MLIQMNCIEFNSWDLGSIRLHENWSSSFIQSCWSPFEILLQTATGAQSVYSCTRSHTCARAINSASTCKQKETGDYIFLPYVVCLLRRNKSVNKQYELQKGEKSAWWNKLMAYIQYIPQSCRQEKKQCLSTSQQQYPSNIQHCHMFLSWARSIQSMSPHSISWKIHFNIILTSTGIKTDLIRVSCK